jgi:hypothetical protein
MYVNVYQWVEGMGSTHLRRESGELQKNTVRTHKKRKEDNRSNSV